MDDLEWEQERLRVIREGIDRHAERLGATLMDAGRINAIRERLNIGAWPTVAQGLALCDALEAAQAAEQQEWQAAERFEQRLLHCREERDAAQAENTHMHEKLAKVYVEVNDIILERNEAQAENTRFHEQLDEERMNADGGYYLAGKLAQAEAEVDRLARQVTDLEQQLEALTGTEHVVEVTEDGWGLQHPYSCRPHLLACPVHQIIDLDGPLVEEVGIYTVTLTEDEREVIYTARLDATPSEDQ